MCNSVLFLTSSSNKERLLDSIILCNCLRTPHVTKTISEYMPV